MYGWNGKILRIDLSRKKISTEKYALTLATDFIGGRGFSIKILWDELKPGIDAFSPQNKLIFAAGPLTGLMLPSSGKLVVAAKSPLTGGYGDGNIGSSAALNLRMAGYDAIVLDGRLDSFCYLWIDNEKTEILDARDYEGLGTFETEDKLLDKHGKESGVFVIGPAGENLVRYATVMSQKGRSGGRPGMGAVMGSKRLKAIVVSGSNEIAVANPELLKSLGSEGHENILKKPKHEFWMRQGTMKVVEWGQEHSVLPTCNFREGVFEKAKDIDGFAMEKLKTSQKGCPNCNMVCGNIVNDDENKPTELDYENIALLGSNIGIGNLKHIAVLNRLADDYGVDTISLGNSIGFAMEASEKKVIDDTIEWGDFNSAKILLENIVYRREVGNLLADGVKMASEKLGGERYAMHVKGLEITGYDCHFAPGMALSYGTSPIGGHHKDAWIISWELLVGRGAYVESKVDKVIEFQRIRGGLFETLVMCRFPWIEVGFDLKWYPKFLFAATGVKMTLNELYMVSDRIYSLIRAFWVREYKNNWSRQMDYPPARWFDDPLTKGPYKGAVLNREKYEILLQWYYKKRGWSNQGIPTELTLKRLGLEYVSKELQY